MKGTFLLYLLFFFLHSQAQQLTGAIKSAKAEQFIYFTFPSMLSQVKDSAAISPSGQFAKKLKLNEPKYITVNYGRFSRQLYVFPSAIIQVSFDASSDSTFKQSCVVKGDHNINAYLSLTAQQQPQARFLGSRIQMSQPIDSLAPVLSSFRRFADSLRTAYFQLRKPDTINKNLQAFLLIDSIEWNSYSLLAAMDYIKIIPSGNKDKFWHDEVRRRMPTNASALHFVAPYFTRLWLYYLKGEYDTQLRSPDSSRVRAMGFTRFALGQAKSNKLNERLEQSVLTQLMADILNMYPYRTLDENKPYDTLITEIKGMVNDAAIIDEFDNLYSQKRAILLSHIKGQQAPEFHLFDSTGKEYHLDDFKSNIVLLDIWASWCLPCIKEFPYLRKLQEQFRGDDRFVLISVSTDASEKEWKMNGLLKHKPPGLTMWVGEGSTFSEDYNISMIPMLILLDEQGKFIEFNPPKASSGDQLYQLIRDTIDKL